jgi:hypothetical protein
VGDGDDTLDDKGGEVLKLEVVKGGKPDNKVSDSCADSIQLIDDVREQVIAGQVTSLLLFALTSEGTLTRLILSNNRFELAGLALEVEKMMDEEAV